MTPDETIALLERTTALLKGHFQLSSGLHSDRYVQCAQALRHPRDAGALGAAIAEQCRDLKVDVVAGPALGGVIIAHEVARALDVPCLFAERPAGSGKEKAKLVFRRGFAIEKGKRYLAVEDVVTTGGSVLEMADEIKAQGGEVVAFACVADRSGGKSTLPTPPRALVKLDLPTWEPGECPLCRSGSIAVKPGSRPGA